MSIPRTASQRSVRTLHLHKEQHHEVCLDAHQPSDLDAAVPQERQVEVYQRSMPGSRSTAMPWPTVAPNSKAPRSHTVKYGLDGGEPVVVDGPFSEAKENVGGFSIIDVPDLDAAIAIEGVASPQYPGVAVEIRPIIDHSGGM